MESLDDLHIYLWPKCLWRIYERTGLAESIPGLISLGFIRMPTSFTLQKIREEITNQLGPDFPKKYYFLRQVGRKVAIIRQRQESGIFASDFLPPNASSPDLFVIENVTIEINSHSNSVSINDPFNEKMSSLTGDLSFKQVEKSISEDKTKVEGKTDIQSFKTWKMKESQKVIKSKSPELENQPHESLEESINVSKKKIIGKNKRKSNKKKMQHFYTQTDDTESEKQKYNGVFEGSSVDSSEFNDFSTLNKLNLTKGRLKDNLEEDMILPPLVTTFPGKRESDKKKLRKTRKPDIPQVIESQLDTFNELNDSEFFPKNIKNLDESDDLLFPSERINSSIRRRGKVKKKVKLSKNDKDWEISDNKRRKHFKPNHNGIHSSDEVQVRNGERKLSKEDELQRQNQLEQIKQLEKEMDKAEHDLLNTSEIIILEDFDVDFSQSSEEKEANITKIEREMTVKLKSLLNEVHKADNERNYLIRQLESLENDKKSKKNDWKYKYFTERKLTKELQMDSSKNEQVLNNIYKNKLRYIPPTQPVVSKNTRMRPGSNANLVIMKTKLELEIEKLKREEESLKTRLFIEMKIKNHEKERAGRNRNILRQYRHEATDHRNRYGKILADTSKSQSDFTFPKLNK